jgi:DNA-directed RNA polymerase subunit RPC12/RpoP
MDIFDARILCKKCGKEMQHRIVNRNGFELRAVECPSCREKIIHPADLNGMENFKDLKDREFNVKLRMVGNSHAISIPKEIIDFMNHRQRDMHRQMDDMVRLWFDDFDTLKMSFDNGFSEKDMKNQDIDEILEDGRRVRRKVRNDGKGNVEVVEEQSLNSPGNKMRSFKIRKIRRFNSEDKNE